MNFKVTPKGLEQLTRKCAMRGARLSIADIFTSIHLSEVKFSAWRAYERHNEWTKLREFIREWPELKNWQAHLLEYIAVLEAVSK